MTPEKLTEQIKKKAKHEGDAAVREFRTTIVKACKQLGTLSPTHSGYDLNTDSVHALVMLCDDEEQHWPARIWRDREARLLEEVLSAMDTPQQVLLAKDEPSEFTAADEG